MKSIIEELCHGNINPNVSSFKPNSPYGLAINRLCEGEEKLLSTLDEAQKAVFQNFSDAQAELGDIGSVEKFCAGFKLGVLLMAEVFNAKDELYQD